jgi:hypothetical protein
MKHMRLLISGLVICGIALAMATTVVAQTAQQGIVKIVNIKGSARFMSAGGTAWQTLKIGTILKAGTIIQTAGGSHVDAVLNNADAFQAPPIGDMSSIVTAGAAFQPKAEQDAIRIYENTVLGVEKLTVTQTGVDTVTETLLDLKHGRIFGSVKKLTGASTYQVKIPNGVAGVRGTLYFLSADGVLSVLAGSTVLAYIGADGNPVTQVVAAGQQFDSRTGKLTTIPVPQLEEIKAACIAFQRPPPFPPTHPKNRPVEPLSPYQPGAAPTTPPTPPTPPPVEY